MLVKTRSLKRPSLFLLLALLLVVLAILYTTNPNKLQNKTNKKIKKSDSYKSLCYNQEAEKYPELSKECVKFLGNSNFYSKEKAGSPEDFETIYDRDLGYTVTKPVGAEEYTWNISTNPVDKYQVDTGLPIEGGKDSYYRYKVTKFFKFPEDSLEKTIDDMVKQLGAGNAVYFTKENSEFVKTFSSFFPDNYEVIYTKLKNWDRAVYGRPSEVLVKEGTYKTYFFIYNPEQPYMFFRFDTADISQGLKKNYSPETGWVEDWSDSLVSNEDLTHYYLPNGLVWQTTFRIIEGNRPFEPLYKSHGVPKNVDLALIKPMSFPFNVRGVDYEFYTPGDPSEGYNFDVVAFGLDRNSVSQGKQTLPEEPFPAERTHTIPEVRQHLKPIVQKYTEEAFGIRNWYTGEELRGYWGDVDGHKFISLGVVDKPNEFESVVQNVWFSEDSFKWVLVDRPSKNEDGTLKYKVTEYAYTPPEYQGYSTWPTTLVNKKELFLNLHSISQEARDYSWVVSIEDKNGSTAILAPRLYSERISYYQDDPWRCEDLAIELDQVENGGEVNVFEETKVEERVNSNGQKSYTTDISCRLD